MLTINDSAKVEGRRLVSRPDLSFYLQADFERSYEGMNASRAIQEKLDLSLFWSGMKIEHVLFSFGFTN